MRTSTTTSNIYILQNGIVVNKLFTASAFKEAYIQEQGMQLDYICKGKEKPLLLDATRTRSSVDNIKKMIGHSRFYSAKSIAVLINSNCQKQLLWIWTKILKPEIPIRFFVQKKAAIKWLEEQA